MEGQFDQTAAGYGVEPRYPFFDRRLVEFCLAAPFEQKLWQGWTRAIFRRAMAGVLPPCVQWRLDKGNLSVNLRRRLLEERETLEGVIEGEAGGIGEYVDMAALRAAYGRYRARPVGVSEGDLFTIVLSVNLALWLQRAGFAPDGT